MWARGGPEPQHDVDFVLTPEDIPRAIDVLERAGMQIVQPPEDWLVKVYDGEYLIDLIHHPVGRPVVRQDSRTPTSSKWRRSACRCWAPPTS